MVEHALEQKLSEITDGNKDLESEIPIANKNHSGIYCIINLAIFCS